MLFNTEQEMLDYAAKFAQQCEPPQIIFLQGELGAGKTTFVRGFLRGLGYEGKVKSPSYHLVEMYEFLGKTIYHFDFYRIKDARELEFLGISECFRDSICLIEWPEIGFSLLPQPTIIISIDTVDSGRKVFII